MSGNVIFIHPDGTSPSHYAAARFASVGTDGRLNWDEMTEAGVYLGHLDDSIVATSNGGAVAHAYGIKPVAPSFGFDENGEQYTSLAGLQGENVGDAGNTIMEDAIADGRATAVINSGFIAEPGTGVFLSSQESRSDRAAITADIIESGVNVILGAGEIDYLPEGTVGFFGEEGTRTDGRNLIEEAEALGYTVVFTQEQLAEVDPGTEMLLGIFAADDTYNDRPEGALVEDGFVDENGELILYGQPGNPNPPTVADMLAATLELDAFQNDEEGFFIVLEEEGTDNFGNNNNAAGTIEAALRADAAIGVAQDYVENVDPDTLIITAADSDGGGLEVDDVSGEDGTVGTIPFQAFIDENGEPNATFVPFDGQTGNGTAPFVTGAPDQDGDVFEFGVTWAGLPDFAGSIVSKTFGLNADLLPATVDNTGIYRIMYETLFDVALDQPEGIPEDPTPAPEPTAETGGVIFIHPDGASPSHFAAARFAQEGTDGRLNWDNLTEAGVYLGHLDDRIVATSNAGAVVHAYGIKAVAPSYGLDENGEQYTSAAGTQNTIMEDAIAAGKPTAVINSGFIAEPGTGVFLSTQESRSDTEAITADIVTSGVNVILGAGETDYLPEGTVGFFGQEGTRTDGRNLIEEAEGLGYTVVFTLSDLLSVDPGTEKLLGIFGAEDTYNDTFEDNLRAQGLVERDGDLQLYGQLPENPNPPTVADMLEVTLDLDLFENATDGFMIVMEEEGTDNFGNNNNGAGVVEAALRADEAIGVAIDYVNNVNPNTLILTAADSDGGGLEVDDTPITSFGDLPGDQLRVQSELVSFGPDSDGIAVPLDGQQGNGAEFKPFITGVPDADGDIFQFGITWSGLPDVAGSIVSKSYGLNSELLGATADNTEMYAIMFETLFGVDPETFAAQSSDEFTVESGVTSVFLDLDLIESATGLALTGVDSEAAPFSEDFQVGFAIHDDTDFSFTADPFAPVGGTIEHDGTVTFNDAVTVGNFSIGFDAGRASDTASGFFVADTVEGNGLDILFDLGAPGVLETSETELTIAEADLLLAPEFTEALGLSELTGADVGDARVDAVLEVPEEVATADFEGLAAGTIVSDQITGFTVATSGPEAMIFDTANPTGGDFDLASDTLGGVLILSEDGNSDNPDDNANGGTFQFTFDELVTLESIGVFDIERAGIIVAYDESGSVLGVQESTVTGNNAVGTVEIGLEGVSRVDVTLVNSGAITELTFA
ncbi:MAG: alkaline phosphatase [Elainellaceae cyanobacterium]